VAPPSVGRTNLGLGQSREISPFSAPNRLRLKGLSGRAHSLPETALAPPRCPRTWRRSGSLRPTGVRPARAHPGPALSKTLSARSSCVCTSPGRHAAHLVSPPYAPRKPAREATTGFAPRENGRPTTRDREDEARAAGAGHAPR